RRMRGEGGERGRFERGRRTRPRHNRALRGRDADGVVPPGAVRLGRGDAAGERDRVRHDGEGMWADPEKMSAGDVSRAHEAGRRVLFSMPMIALIPRVYEAEAALLDIVCRDVSGEPAECESCTRTQSRRTTSRSSTPTGRFCGGPARTRSTWPWRR